MMMPVPQLMSAAEFLPGRPHVVTHIDDRPIPVSNDLSFAADQRPIFDRNTNAVCNRFNCNIAWIGYPLLIHRLFECFDLNVPF